MEIFINKARWAKNVQKIFILLEYYIYIIK